MNEIASETVSTAKHHKSFHCGTLTYTKAGLTALFAWLLWGDFCYTLMETVVPTVLPLNLKILGCPNWLMGLIMTTGPCILNMTVCPYVSFKSDRYRSKWGRRIPFIVWTMPFLCGCLALLGFSGDITVFLQNHIAYFREIAPASLTIALIGVFMIMFTFFNMFVGSVFWYLFNDVVPAQFLGRFVGLFRIVGTAAGAGYNFFIFKYAETNMREIILGGSVLYLVGFGLMCYFVREGQYPPVEEEAPGSSSKGIEGLKSFLKESFTNKFYWIFFIFNMLLAVGWAIMGFQVFFYKNMGLTLAQIGDLNGVLAIASLFAMYLSAIFIDRWHPIRVAVYLTLFSVIAALMNWVWLFVNLPAIYFFYLSLGIGLVTTFQVAMSGGYGLPLFMRLLPRSRYGQFCSAAALVRSFGSLCAGAVAGLFLDFARWFSGNSDFGYRYIFVWATLSALAATVFVILLYRKWYQLGGDANYHPPAPWSEHGTEELPIVTIQGPSSRWLRWSFWIFHATMALTAIGVAILMWWMFRHGANTAFYWHAVLMLPLAIASWCAWIILERGIWRDIARVRAGEKPRNGIPHHGMLIIVGSKFLLLLGLWVFQVVISVNHQMELAAIVFTAATIISNFLEIICVWIMCRVERGYSNVIDQRLSISDDDRADEVIEVSPCCQH